MLKRGSNVFTGGKKAKVKDKLLQGRKAKTAPQSFKKEKSS